MLAAKSRMTDVERVTGRQTCHRENYMTNALKETPYNPYNPTAT